VRARASRDQERLDSGAVASAKELESLQHEIASLQRRQGDLEDAELEVLQRVEDLDHSVTALQARRSDLLSRQDETMQRRDEEIARITEEQATTSADREQVAVQLPSDLVAFYDKLRDQLGGVAVAALKQRRCDGCRLELNATEVGRFREAAEDAVLRCEECRRVVVRTAESGL
jgi:predicted  nucleic acid-binding Zn-ribbon protein